MFAVIKAGGQQFCVAQDDIIKINKINAEKDAVIDVNDVLMCTDNNGKTLIGTPLVAGASVKLQVLDNIKNDKVIVFKKHRRHNYRRKNGHRQPMTVVKVLEISLGK